MLASSEQVQEKKTRPPDEEAVSCPRCHSMNTKFCYYNNYSLCQPRYFCKSCRRYWTKGGALRNVPEGGGSRKNKRPSSSWSSSSKRPRKDKTHPKSASPVPSLSQMPFGPDQDSSFALVRLENQNAGQLGLDQNDLSMMGNQPDMFDALGGGFLETFSWSKSDATMENGGSPDVGEVFEEEICGGTTPESGVLWGTPQQSIGEGSNKGGGADFERFIWNNRIGSPNWHALLNNPMI